MSDESVSFDVLRTYVELLAMNPNMVLFLGVLLLFKQVQRTFNKTAEYRGVEPITWFQRSEGRHQ